MAARVWASGIVLAAVLAWGLDAEGRGPATAHTWTICSAPRGAAPAARGRAGRRSYTAQATGPIGTRGRAALRTELEDRWGAAASLGSLGRLYARFGEAGRAEQTAQECLEALSRVGDRVGAAWAICQVGVFDAPGPGSEWTRSRIEESHRQADERVRAEEAVRTLHARGREHLEAGEPREAARLADLAMRELARIAGDLAEEQSAVLRDDWALVFDLGLDAAAAEDDAAGAYHFLEAGRACELLAGVRARSVIQSATLAPALREADIWARVRETAASRALATARATGERKAIRRAREELDEARRARRQVLDRILAYAKDEAESNDPRPAMLETLCASLEDGDAMVLYGLLGQEARALVATCADARLVDLGSLGALEAAVHSLDPEDGSTSPAADIRRLRSSVIEPLCLPDSTRRVIVCPQGALAEVPFSLLLPDCEVAQVPSATMHVHLSEGRVPQGSGVLAFGDPLYCGGDGIPPLALPNGGPSLHPLPHSRLEAEAVGSTVRVGAAASETALRTMLAGDQRWRALHIACHGILDPERPRLSALALTPTAEDDGLLTALDVTRTEVPADLVVLSGCETGRGKVFRGEGVLGLARAFLLAGAPRVLVSLWPVDDEATRRLMTVFYERWQDGRSVTTALREAQAVVRAEPRWEHPRYWASWVLWGCAD